MKLYELHINDFKFFSKVEENSPLLKIDGKHLLIYGENGSGKSTIYWALYTLLEASLKKNDDDIRKYFKKIGDDSLVNIHSTGKNNTYIKAVLKDDAGNNPKTFRVSRKSRDLSIRGDADVVKSNMATDFINYRVLFQLHNLKHSKENDLWQWFEEEVLPYVKRGDEPCLNELEVLKKGPEKVRNIDGDYVFPTANLRTSASIEERKDYQKYKTYKQKVKAWNDWLKGFISDITNNANDLIEQEFQYNFKIKLTLETKFPEFDANDEKIEWVNPKIIISIPEYEGIQNPKIKKPHTFLNEAKWSAIGLSLRFAILDIKLYNADLKSLVIDDMILSLDMSNRDVVINLLLNKYANDYQLILMTHDKFFFELSKYKISQLRLTNWKYFEMFDVNDGTISKPLIIEGTSKIKKVWSLYHKRELAQAANTLRKATEKLCKAYLTTHERLNADYGIKNLHQMIEAFRTKGAANGLDVNKLTRLLEYKDRILNPNSHYDIETPLFKNELKKAIETVEELANDTGINV
jgi:energy-coupling factor transporter ATP-binding protein EcfA2